MKRILCLPCSRVIFRAKVPAKCRSCGASAFLTRDTRPGEIQEHTRKAIMRQIATPAAESEASR